MAGIASCGVYLPRYRLDRALLYQAVASWLNPAAFLPGERTVANWDEDSLTMGVEAARDCLGEEREGIGAVYFATTTPPYAERMNAGILATALDLGEGVKTADFTGSPAAGMRALLSALREAEGGRRVLVVASDCRMGRAGSLQEAMYGDAAAAVLVGEERLARVEGSFTLSQDFPDYWRVEGEAFTRSWEDRWIREEGYLRFLRSSVEGLLKQHGLSPGQVSRLALPPLFPRDQPRLARELGFSEGQVQPSLFEQVGNAGAAHPLLLLAAALEETEPGGRVVVAGYGAGSDSLLLTVTGRGERKVERALRRRKELDSYEKYLAWRGMMPAERGMRGEEVAPTSLSLSWRERRAILGLVGSRCRACGTPQYPPQRVCVACGGTELEPYRFSERRGRIFSYTEDMLAFSVDRPAIYGIVDFEGGGRFWFDFTDCGAGELRVGMPVRMSFRRKYTDPVRGIVAYFWKAVPEVRDGD
ncbi:MAG: zinc ribbon domain-containing protein [Hadesarchaea archaeon]|jgi:hydroxymethylglutaryl-CoA synthase|nr:zinc ribbon domain-containing protein [Hadesarchaea archaeon]